MPTVLEVEMPPNIGENDSILIHSSDRQDGLPTLYLAAKHAKRDTSRAGRVMYYISDLSRPAMEEVTQIERKLRIPHGTEQDAVSKGFFKLEEDDIVFSRGTEAPADGSDDSAVCWVTGKRIYSADMIQRMLAARDAALGPPELRTRNRPIKVGSEFIGATAIERTTRAKPVHENTRCFTIANSSEPITNKMAPAADNKKLGEEDDDVLAMRGNLLRSMSELSMKSMEEGPTEILEHIRLNADILNVPATGVEDNVAYTAAQINIAPAEPQTSKSTLAKSMGLFGGEHQDTKDNPAYYTHMIAVSDLPESFDPGRFFILYPGVFISLTNLASINFSGLRMHGGTAPRAPEGTTTEELDQAVRVACISYPPNGQTTGNQRYALGALPGTKKKPGETFFIPPEFTQAKELAREDRAWCVHAAYLEDGGAIIPRQKQVEFFARSMYSATNFFALQLPKESGLKIDMNQFLGAFSMPDEDGVRRSLKAWPSGPGYQRPSTLSLTNTVVNSDEFVNQAPIRAEKHARWMRYRRHVASHIPFAVCKGDADEIGGGDEIGIQRGGVDDNGESEEEDVERLLIPDLGGRPAPQKKTQARTATEANLPGPSRARKVPRTSHQTHVNLSQADNEVAIHAPAVPNATLLFNELRKQGTLTGHVRQTANSKNNTYSLKLGVTYGRTTAPVIRNESPTQVPSFLTEMTSAALEKELESVRNAVIKILATGADHAERSNIAALDRLQFTLTSSPVGVASPISIGAAWPAFMSLLSLTHESALALRKHRAATMLIHYTLWYWLDVFIEDVVGQILRARKGKGKDVTGMDWLMKLVESVKETYDLKIGRHTFIARGYGIDLPTECQISTEKFPSGAARKKAITNTVTKILETWLRYPQNPNARPQAWFTHVIISQFDTDFLYLDHIWTAYTTICSNSFRYSSWKLQRFQDVHRLATYAGKHALFDHNSTAFQSVKSLASLIHDYFSGSLELAPPGAEEVAVFRDRIPSCLQVAAESRMATFVRFLQDAVAYQLHTPHHTFSYPVFQQKLQDIPDKAIPFREVAPGRLRLAALNGPYNPTTIRTTSGFFSALIFRGITFATRFSLVGDMMFQSTNDFDQARAKFNAPLSFFCDSRAYGTPSRRAVDYANVYWEMLVDGCWEEFAGTRVIPFRECYSWVVGMHFPQIGPLCAYLLTADLVYSGVVSAPSRDDITWAIRELNRGAVSAMHHLALLTPAPVDGKNRPKSDLAEVKSAFRLMMDMVIAAIPSDERQALAIDNIAIEHILCKFIRAVKWDWLQ